VQKLEPLSAAGTSYDDDSFQLLFLSLYIFFEGNNVQKRDSLICFVFFSFCLPFLNANLLFLAGDCLTKGSSTQTAQRNVQLINSDRNEKLSADNCQPVRHSHWVCLKQN
jgi:hypothetical protein